MGAEILRSVGRGPVLDHFLNDAASLMHPELLYKQTFYRLFVYNFHSLKSPNEEPRKNFAQFYEKSELRFAQKQYFDWQPDGNFKFIVF